MTDPTAKGSCHQLMAFGCLEVDISVNLIVLVRLNWINTMWPHSISYNYYDRKKEAAVPVHVNSEVGFLFGLFAYLVNIASNLHEPFYINLFCWNYFYSLRCHYHYQKKILS